MSVIRKIPFIEEVLGSLSEEILLELRKKIDSDGGNVYTTFATMPNKNTVTPVVFQLSQNNNAKTGLLIYTDDVCVLISYHRFQDLQLYNLNPTNYTYEKINEYCDINELRRVLDDTIEKTGAIDSGDADKGQIPVADGEGGVEWKDNFQELVLTNQSGTLTDDEIALAKEGNTVARLGSDGQFYYKDAQNNYYVIFKAAARVANDDTIVEKITIDLSDNTYSYSYDVVAAGESFTPTYDDELSDASTNAVQNKVVTKALNDTVADIESGRTVAGKAKTAEALDNVSENSGSTQEDPFIAQGTGTNNNTSETPTSPKAHQLEKQGNTVCVNQWVKNGNFDNTNNWTANGGSLSTSNNVGTFTPSQQYGNLASDVINMISGHTYLIRLNIQLSAGTSGVVVRLNNDTTQNISVSANTNKQLLSFIANPTQSNRIQIIDSRASDWGNIQISNVSCSNLTQWFGSNENIPEYILDHPEAFINYYNGSLDYNTGQLVSSNGRYLVTIGFNQLNDSVYDNDQFIGNYYIQGSTQDYVREANNSYNCYRIKICHYDITDTEYCITKNKNETLGSVGIVRFVDKDYNLISGNESGYSATKYNVISVPTNAEYMEIAIPISADYKVCVNLSWDTQRDGEYQQYIKHNYDTGTEQLDAFDVKRANGEIDRQTGTELDLSQLVWTLVEGDDYWYWQADFAKGQKVFDSAEVVKGISQYYIPTTGNAIGGSDNTFAYTGNSLRIRNNSTLTQPGGILKYMLATPTIEYGTPFDEIIDVDDYGTMQWLDADSDFVEVPQGCKLFYPADYALLIDDLGNYTGYDVTKLAKKSELDTTFETYLKGLTGYDATKTQKLQNVEGALTWVDEE